MKQGIYLIIAVLFSIVSINCAFSVHQTPLNYQYSGEIPEGMEKLHKTVLIGEFKDTRGTSTPNMIMNMRNLNGNVTTGGWEAEQPISEVVKQAIGEGLGKIQLVSASNNNLVLTGEVMKFSIDAIMTAGLGQKYKGMLSTKIQLTDSETKKIIFRDTYSGQGIPCKGANGSKGIIKDTFTKALDNLVETIISDQYFLQQFE